MRSCLRRRQLVRSHQAIALERSLEEEANVPCGSGGRLGCLGDQQRCRSQAGLQAPLDGEASRGVNRLINSVTWVSLRLRRLRPQYDKALLRDHRVVSNSAAHRFLPVLRNLKSSETQLGMLSELSTVERLN